MINALHLLWIVPLSASIGAVLFACFLVPTDFKCIDDCSACPYYGCCEDKEGTSDNK